jgi:hypothetical protein
LAIDALSFALSALGSCSSGATCARQSIGRGAGS